MNIISSLLYFIGERMIAEEGTSDGWNYRKWENGKIEAWYTAVKTSESVTLTQWGSVWYYDLAVSFPSGLFTSAPTQILATSKNAQFSVFGCWAVSSNGFTARMIRPTNTTQRVDVSIYAVYN